MTRRQPQYIHKHIDTAAGFLALVLTAFAYWYGVYPVMHTEERSRLLNEQMHNSSVQLEEAQERYRRLRQDIHTAHNRLEQLEIVLDTPNKLAERQDEISRMFSDSGLSIDQLSVGAVVQGEYVDIIPLQLSGKGRFPNVVSAMHGIRVLFPDMAVSVFQIGSAGSSGREDIVYSFEVSWFVGRDGEPSL